MAQFFLREEVRAAQTRFGDTAQDSQFARRMEYLLSLTTPADGRGKKQTNTSGNRAGAAFVELYQEMPLYRLVGEDALTFGADLTVGQYSRMLFDKGWQPVGTSPEGMRLRVQEEAAIMTKIIQQRGISIQ